MREKKENKNKNKIKVIVHVQFSRLWEGLTKLRVFFYNRIIKFLLYKNFASLWCSYLGASFIPYVQDAILNPPNPYIRSTTVFLDKHISMLGAHFLPMEIKYVLNNMKTGCNQKNIDLFAIWKHQHNSTWMMLLLATLLIFLHFETVLLTMTGPHKPKEWIPDPKELLSAINSTWDTVLITQSPRPLEHPSYSRSSCH